MPALRIDIWSDIACPWCYVGKRRLEAALSQFAHRDAVEIIWHAFELNPAAPRRIGDGSSYPERLAKKYGTSVAEAKARIARLTELGKTDGLVLDFERIQPGNTFDAHRVIHLARERGIQDAVKERFLRGYLTEGEAIGEPEVLVRLGAEAGLDPEEVRALLASEQLSDEVRSDENDAREIGIQGVPFFVLAERYAISGAQPAELFLQALEQTWNEIDSQPAPVAEGAACGPDGCA